MNMTDYAAKKFLEHALGTTAWTAPAQLYVGLFQSDPGADGEQTSELSGSGYARVAVDFAEEDNRVCLSEAAVETAAATGNWGVVTHVGLLDASSAGNMLFYAPLKQNGVSTAANITTGQSVRFDQGDIAVSVS